MITGLFKGAGKLALWAATMAFLISVSLLLIGSFILTWPIMRKSPRDQKIKAMTDVAAVALEAMQVFGPKVGGNNGRDS